MEAAALCLTLVFILLGGFVQIRDAAFRIVPNKLQVFEYEPVSFHCEGLDGSSRLRGIRRTEEFLSGCAERTPVLSCTVKRAYLSDGGEYWCETEGGERSNRVNISVTAGSVILESPAVPVKDGHDVTLSCRNKTTASNLTARFYKDGLLIRRSSTGNMTIYNVSKSDEGLYKCSISGAGESPQSWFSVRGVREPLRQTCSSLDHSIYVLLLLRTVFTVVMVALLLLLLGLLHCGKVRVRNN